jgi:HSP20 family protein
MQLIKWEPFSGLTSLRRDIDRLFDSFFESGSRIPIADADWMPRFDLIESVDSLVIKADLPGMNEKDISVSLSGDNLVFKGERKLEKKEKEKQYHRVERRFGSFQRIIPLPVTIEGSKIKAEYKHGVLTLNLPKKPEARPMEIPITVDK